MSGDMDIIRDFCASKEIIFVDTLYECEYDSS
jgi:hypothetical protein